MLDILSNNLFYGTDTSAKYGILEVLEYYDIEGCNWIFLHRDDSSLKYMVSNKKIIYSPQNLQSLIGGGKNLFKVDLIVIESTSNIISDIRKVTNLPIIVIPKNLKHNFPFSDYDTVYEFSSESHRANKPSSGFLTSIESTDHFVLNKNTNDKYNLKSLRIARRRDRAIDDLLD